MPDLRTRCHVCEAFRHNALQCQPDCQEDTVPHD